MHVVDEQRVSVEVAALECLEARLVFAVVDRGDGVFRDELLRIDIHHAHIGPRFQDVVLDSSQQVRLSQTAFSVDEQGVQGRFAGRFRYRYGHRISQTVRVADDEVLEGKRGRARVHAICARDLAAREVARCRGLLRALLRCGGGLGLRRDLGLGLNRLRGWRDGFGVRGRGGYSACLRGRCLRGCCRLRGWRVGRRLLGIVRGDLLHECRRARVNLDFYHIFGFEQIAQRLLDLRKKTLFNLAFNEVGIDGGEQEAYT